MVQKTFDFRTVAADEEKAKKIRGPSAELVGRLAPDSASCCFPPTPTMALLPPSTSSTEPLWQVVLRTHMNGVVLWNQELNALRLEALDSLDPRLLADTDDPDGLEIISADEAPTATASSASVCPLCLQKLQPPHRQAGGGRPTPSPTNSFRRLPGRRPNGSVSYFSLLSEANSRTQSPRTTNRSEESIGTETGEPMPESSLNAGYYR